jgi:hypothetical protein
MDRNDPRVQRALQYVTSVLKVKYNEALGEDI